MPGLNRIGVDFLQHKQPKFNGILVVAVLMVLVLFFVSLSPLLAASATKGTTYSEIYYYFENQQVTSFRLDLGTGSLELWLKEGKAELPESNAAASLPSGGLLSLGDTDDDELPANGGTVYMTYKLPYGGDFNTGKISDFVDEYNAANPDAPMVFDYVAAKTSIPWLEIIFYVAMIGSIGMLFMSMYRGGAGGGIMNVGRAKVKDQQENQRKATFADVAGADEEKAELQEVVEFLKAPNKFNSLGARIPHGVLLVGLRAPAKRCWRAPAQARPVCRSTPSPALTSSRCTSVSARPVCVTCSRRPKRRCPPSSLSTRSTRLAASAAQASAAVTTSASRP